MDATQRALTSDSLQDFLQLFGNVFEHSTWLVERAWAVRPFADGQALYQALRSVLQSMNHEERLRLVRAHPELAGKVAIAKNLTGESSAEQASAGLDRLTPTQFERFHALNEAYRRRHAFPFIICVRLHDKTGILSAMQRRVDRSSPDELDEAIEQISQICRLRVEAITGESLQP
ncbi:MAG TPA: 2-oxo-4-hydroxy-4-carboxy-5-ureidoimidazoline decarboxylase [Steroidobacteraceae bacterium]|jgi:2-oxo-4-hydroxy-4-carboxy-5-ureidoimidazoline decarboxylase|nr:2-oxo-4-hydroxy-4-carboxy-5-ureidoimidazoline decarboxylase [Steroidobacteraceae bacterium]